tara:strand:+ start:771 stop:1661 length:891 start_codon:yes stop_codon:yes gene_type:complete
MINNNIEYLKQHPYVSDNISIDINEEPFPHIVINNLFKDDIYEMVSSNFMDMIGRTKPYKDLPGAVHDYAAYIYGLKKGDCKYGYDFFVDDIWKNFNMITFGVLLNKYIAMSVHWHEAPSKPGFVHNDYNICSVMDEGSSDFTLTGNCYYSDDTAHRTPNAHKISRSIAILYYLNNQPTTPNDGGTSIYGNYQFHSKIKDIPANSNSVFVFAVQPNSYHGFTGANFNRSAMVQWFHSSPAYMVHKYKDLMKERQAQYRCGFERWQPNEMMWDIRNDPEYKKYFPNQNLTLEQLLNS